MWQVDHSLVSSLPFNTQECRASPLHKTANRLAEAAAKKRETFWIFVRLSKASYLIVSDSSACSRVTGFASATIVTKLARRSSFAWTVVPTRRTCLKPVLRCHRTQSLHQCGSLTPKRRFAQYAGCYHVPTFFAVTRSTFCEAKRHSCSNRTILHLPSPVAHNV